MKETLAIVGSVIVAVSFLPYLLEVIRGKVKPRISTWITWSFLTTVSTVAAISAHAYTSALLTGAATAVEILILVYGLHNGELTHGRIDATSQTLSVLGIIAWLITNNPAFALGFNIIADLSGAVPTYYHAWVKPHEEQWQSFAVFAVGSFMTIFGVSKFDFVNLAFPIYLTFSASSIGLDIFIRQRLVKA